MGHIYTYEEIKQEFENRDYVLVTDIKLKCSEKYEYICKKHIDKGSQFIDWGHFHSGKRGCYYCGRERTIDSRKKDLSEFNAKELAESKGLPFDYYLPDYNILIEYDGEGHYIPINFGGMTDDEAVEHMLYTQRHDEIKTEYCKNSNIPLIRIPYWEKNNLEEYLINLLKQYELKQCV